MSYSIQPGERLIDGLRRIAVEQLDRAIDEVDDATIDRNVVVHQVRKRCKKIRAMLRLVNLPSISTNMKTGSSVTPRVDCLNPATWR